MFKFIPYIILFCATNAFAFDGERDWFIFTQDPAHDIFIGHVISWAEETGAFMNWQLGLVILWAVSLPYPLIACKLVDLWVRREKSENFLIGR